MNINKSLFQTISRRWTGGISPDLRDSITSAAAQHVIETIVDADQLGVDETLPNLRDAIFGMTNNDDDDGFI